jgi:hypothetical protein
MHRFAAQLAFDVLNKTQTPNGNRFRPAIVPLDRRARQRILYPFAVCSLKISPLRKPT